MCKDFRREGGTFLIQKKKLLHSSQKEVSEIQNFSKNEKEKE